MGSGFNRNVVNPNANGRLGGVLYEGPGAGRCNCNLVSTYPYAVAPDGGMGNYIVFRAVTGSSFALTVKPAAGVTNPPRAPVNGFQIVSPSGS